MNLDQIANLAEIIGVTLVIASLIYVAKQLRQNTNAVHAQTRQAVLVAAQSELFAVMENPDLVISIVKMDSLTPEEHVRLSSWLFAAFRAREFAWLQYKNGVIDETQWKTEVGVIQFIFDSQRTRDWWAKIGRVPYGTDFVEFVDSVIRGQPATETTWQTITRWSAPDSGDSG